MEQILPGAH